MSDEFERIALGFVETAGLVMAIEVADAMAKAAEVNIIKAHKVDGLRVCVICKGDVGSVKAAVDVGAELARSGNALLCANVIPSPADPEATLAAMLNDIQTKKAARKAAMKARRAAAAAPAPSEAEETAGATAPKPKKK